MLCYCCSEELGVFCESVCVQILPWYYLRIPTGLTKVCITEFNTQWRIFIYTCRSNNCPAIKTCKLNVISQEYSIGPLWSSPSNLYVIRQITPPWWTVAHNTRGWSGGKSQHQTDCLYKTSLSLRSSLVLPLTPKLLGPSPALLLAETLTSTSSYGSWLGTSNCSNWMSVDV